jgi:hypothetical protein
MVFLACFSLQVMAEEVAGLYRGLVPVSDQSVESRDAGVRDALAQVLIKLTGNGAIMQSPRVQPFLTNPSAFVSAVGFRNLPALDDSDTAGEERIGLDVSFDRRAVDQLIRQAQLPVLPSNRPKLLVWIIRDDAVEGRDFVSSDTAKAVVESFDRAMKERGMPYLLPNFDLQDQLSLSVNEAWSLRADLIDPASERYNTDGWIALRFYTTSSGEVRGAWLYQTSGRRQLNDFRAAPGEAFMADAVGSLVDSLTRAYTYIPQLDTSQMLVKVAGVVSFADYQAVLAQLNKLELVDSVELFAVQGDQLTLAIEAEAGADLLRSALMRSSRFDSQPEREGNITGQLNFNWIGN